MAETRHPSPEHWRMEAQLAPQPRLVASLSSFQRQEVSGGFLGSTKGEIRPDAETSSREFVGGSLRHTPTPRDDGAPESRALESLRGAQSSETPTVPPGVQIRLFRPHESAIQPSGDHAGTSGRSAIASSKPPAPPSAAPPTLDINALADRVYQTLQRRHQLERERRGLY
jgi:hypothetical protein